MTTTETASALNSVNWSIVAPAIATIFVAFIAGMFTWISGRKKSSADVQTVINTGFQALIKELQNERTELTKIVERQSTELVLQATEIKEQKTIIYDLKREIRQVRDEMADLLTSWREGRKPPPETDGNGSNRP